MVGESNFSIFQLLILVIGATASGAMIVGCFFSYLKKDSTTTFIFAGSGLLSVLVTMALTWFGYVQEKAMVQEAIANANSYLESAKAMAGLTDCAKIVTYSFWLSILPLVLGIALLVRGMFLLPNEEANLGNRVRLVTAMVCVAVGVRLSLVAFVDYLRFDDFFALLLLLT